MPRRLAPLGLLALLALSPAVVNAAEGDTDERCGVCHSDVRVQYRESIHARDRIGCADCHGGNPDTEDLKAAHGGRFTGRLERSRIPELCASCHASIERMKPYNLSTDQYALYRSSQHGIEVAKGSKEAAVCTDCHGVHDIRTHDDPQSRTNIRNIPGTCARCHSDQALIERHGFGGDALAEYMTSVHADALYEKGNLHSPDCSRCHGVHGAAPPGVGDVSKVCGQCHATARSYFERSPHREAMARSGNPECASCHSNHAIRPADDKVLESTCASCHAKDDKALAVAAEIEAELQSTRKTIEEAAEWVRRAEAEPLDVEDYKSRLAEARTYHTETLPVVHSFSTAEVSAVATRARSISHEVSSEIEEKFAALRWRVYGIGIFWFYILLTVGILARYRYRTGREESGRVVR